MILPRFTRLIAAYAAILFPFGASPAANVLFVDDETPNASWQELIESGGHTYTLFDKATYNFSLNNQDSIDYVNAFDVIVISGSNPLFNAIRAHGAVWNAQPTPMINLGNFLISGQFQAASWRWTTPGNGGTTNSSGVVDVLAADDPIWTGVSLTPGTPPTIGLFSGNVGHLTLGANTFLPDITTVAAQSSNNATIAMAYAAPEALREGGGPQYFIAGMVGGTNNPVNFNDDGKQVFLNAIAALTGGFAPDGPFPVSITQNPDTPGTFDFEWASQPGKLYDLLTSIDLAEPVADWPVYDDGVTLHEAIPSAGETTTRTAVPSADPRRFFAVHEYDAPPPPPLFFFDFEENDGGFTVVTTGAGSAWAYGEPDAEIENVITIQGGNDGSAKAWGVNLTGTYAAGTVTSLRSPPIDLGGLAEGTGVQLSYALAIDMASGASLVVRVIAEDSDTVIGDELQSINAQTSATWAEAGPFDLPEDAIGEIVRIEWLFTGPTDSTAFLGPYIDDVQVTETAP